MFQSGFLNTEMEITMQYFIFSKIITFCMRFKNMFFKGIIKSTEIIIYLLIVVFILYLFHSNDKQVFNSSYIIYEDSIIIQANYYNRHNNLK